jgi:hypothetical protein
MVSRLEQDSQPSMVFERASRCISLNSWLRLRQARSLRPRINLLPLFTLHLCFPTVIPSQIIAFLPLWTQLHLPVYSTTPVTARVIYMPTSRTIITDPSSIPTLADLWAQNEIQKHPKPEAKPNDEINKRVSIWRGKPISYEHEQD